MVQRSWNFISIWQAEQLANPQYGEYHILFTNVLREDLLQKLATGDEKDVVKQVQEFYADFYATTSSLFTLVSGIL